MHITAPRAARGWERRRKHRTTHHHGAPLLAARYQLRRVRRYFPPGNHDHLPFFFLTGQVDPSFIPIPPPEIKPRHDRNIFDDEPTPNFRPRLFSVTLAVLPFDVTKRFARLVSCFTCDGTGVVRLLV